MAPPPAPSSLRGGTNRELAGILFLAAVGEAYQAYGTLNSSPQTTELFAGSREKTLMKYVMVGHGSALFFGSIASWVARSLWPIAGTAIVIVQMEWIYKHAARAGKGQPPPVSKDDLTPAPGAVSDAAGTSLRGGTPASWSAPTSGGQPIRTR